MRISPSKQAKMGVFIVTGSSIVPTAPHSGESNVPLKGGPQMVEYTAIIAYGGEFMSSSGAIWSPSSKGTSLMRSKPKTSL
jgi:hypothetical protein